MKTLIKATLALSMLATPVFAKAPEKTPAPATKDAKAPAAKTDAKAPAAKTDAKAPAAKTDAKTTKPAK